MHKASEWLQSFGQNSTTLTNFNSYKKKFESCIKVSVTSGKGGVGKTSVALKASQELALLGYRVLLIDCDSNLSNTGIKLGLPCENKFEKILTGEISFEDALVRQGRFHLLPACNGSVEVFRNKLSFDQIVIDIIEAHENEYDFIFLDCPAGISREMLTLNSFCHYRWIVVTPDKSSITDSYSLIKLLSSEFGINSNQLIINMAQDQRQVQKVSSILGQTVGNFLSGKLELLGGIHKVEVNTAGFDTFFLSQNKNEFQRNFVKLLYRFTEKVSGPLTAAIPSGRGPVNRTFTKRSS